MRSGMFRWLLVVFSMAVVTMASGRPAAAEDELRVTGIVKSIDPITHLVTVDVRSSSCAGTRTFRIDDLDRLEGRENKQISFFIDSSRCVEKEIYNMIFDLRGVRK